MVPSAVSEGFSEKFATVIYGGVSFAGALMAHKRGACRKQTDNTGHNYKTCHRCTNETNEAVPQNRISFDMVAEGRQASSRVEPVKGPRDSVAA